MTEIPVSKVSFGLVPLLSLLSWLASCSTAELKDIRTTNDAGFADDGGIVDDASVDPGDDGGPQIGEDGGTLYPFTSAVRVIVEPSDTGSALRDAITNAKASVHVTMYLLTSSTIIDALIAQKNAGHDVKVVLNQNFPTGTSDNLQAFNQLKGAGVQVVWSPPAFAFTHEKCVIVDGTEAWIMTMNATFSAPTDNREYLVVDTDAKDVAQAEALFQGDFTDRSVSAPGKLIVSPVNARDALKALLRGATSTIDVEVEGLSDDQIVAELGAAQKSGKSVRVVLDGSQPFSPAEQTAVTTLKGQGVKLVKRSTPAIHAKAIVVDGARAFVGSQNFTSNALLQNRELGVFFDAATEVNKVKTTIAQDFTAGTAL